MANTNFPISMQLSSDLEIAILERRLKVLRFLSRDPHSCAAQEYSEVRSRKALIATLSEIENMVAQSAASYKER